MHGAEVEGATLARGWAEGWFFPSPAKPSQAQKEHQNKLLDPVEASRFGTSGVTIGILIPICTWL